MNSNQTKAEKKLAEMEQKIHRMQVERQKLKNQIKSEEKRKRDHAMIVVGTTLMTHFPGEVERIINADDETIKTWVHGLIIKREPGTAHDERAAETQHEYGRY